MDIDDDTLPTGKKSSPSAKASSIIVETFSETFLITPYKGAEDKENLLDGVGDYSPALRYTITLVRTPELILAKDSDVVSNRAEAKVASDDSTVAEPSASQEPNATTQLKAPIGHDNVRNDPSSGANGTTGADKAHLSAPVLGPPSEDPPSEGSSTNVEPKAAVAQASSDKLVPTTGSSPVEPAPVASRSSLSPMDISPPEPAESTEQVGEPAVSITTGSSDTSKSATGLQVLQRNVGQDDIRFDPDGFTILTDQIEHGMRKGWKIEARSWRWMTGEPVAV